MSKYGYGYDCIQADVPVAPACVPHNPANSAFLEFAAYFGYDAFASHIPTLAAAAMKAGVGDFVEFGGGFSSTPLLSALANAQARRFISVEHDPEWMKVVSYFNRNVVVSEADAADQVSRVAGRRVALAFVDGADRGAVMNLISRDPRFYHTIVVVHDFGDYGDYGRLAGNLSGWKEGALVRALYPWTAVFTHDRDRVRAISEVVGGEVIEVEDLDRIAGAFADFRR